MKVYEIISENQVDEAWYTGLLNRGLSKVAGKVAGKMMSKADFIEREAGVVANLARSRGISMADALAQHEAGKAQAVKKYMSDAIAAAKKAKQPAPNMAVLQKEAEEAAGIHPTFSKDASIQRKIIAKAEETHGAAIAGKVGEFGGKAWSAGMLGLKGWGLYEMWWPPLSDYRESMANAKAKLDSGEWNQAKFDYVENQQLSILIGRLGAALLITTVPAMLVNNKITRAILGKHLGGILDLGTTAGVIAFRSWLNRDDNADSIAAIMMNDYVAGNAQIMGNPIPGLGSMAAALKHKITGDITADPNAAKTGAGGGADTSPATTTTGATGTPGAKQDIASTSTGITPGNHGDAPEPGAAPNTTPSHGDAPVAAGPGTTTMGRKMWSNDPMAINNYDITGWQTMPGKPGFIQDPNNRANFLPKPPNWTP